MRTSRTLVVCAAMLAALPAPAAAGGGGAAAPGSPSAGAGGGSFGAPVPDEANPAGPRKRRRGTLLTSFELRGRHIYLHGRPARIRFTLSGRRAVHVHLRVLSAADRSRVATVDLGERAPGEHSTTFTGLEAGVLPEGRYLLHITGRGLRRASKASSTADIEFSHHAFPIAGAFDWGSEGSRFGATREGHTHQGQDLAAAEGTGHYVVLDGDDEDHDYVFMHLRSGSITVNEGDRVRTGQRLGEVGSTGRSTGPHLHFEIWVGGWFAGGEPIDPLPLLQTWAGGA